jgi:hypothetical protein
MKQIFIVLSFFFIPSAFADCYQEISLDYSRSSRTFYLAPDEVEEYPALNEEKAMLVVDILLKRETSCELKDVVNSIEPASCHKFRSGVTCEVLTNLGYFIVHRSAYGTFDHSVIYTRWD